MKTARTTVTVHELEAQFLMGHRLPLMMGTEWPAEFVQEQLNIKDGRAFNNILRRLEPYGLVNFSYYAEPDESSPRDEQGSYSATVGGVLSVANMFARPWVQFSEAPKTLHQHWMVVMREWDKHLLNQGCSGIGFDPEAIAVEGVPSFSGDTTKRIHHLAAQGHSTQEIAQAIGRSRRTVQRVLQAARAS